MPSTTLFFRNYYAGHARRVRSRRRRWTAPSFFQIFWRIVVPLSTPILVVTLIWQFTSIWNDFPVRGGVLLGADSKPITVGLNNLAEHVQFGQGIQRGHGRGR